MSIRRSAVAGTFYEFNPQDLKKQIEWCLTHKIGPGRLPLKARKAEKRKIIGLISPHAGYIYSGPVAAHGYLKVFEDGKPDIIIIVGPNHTGYGPSVSVMSEGVWETPLGTVEIDSETAKEILHESHYARSDKTAHLMEHSVEVQIPFLQYFFRSDFKIVPIVMMLQTLETALDLGKSIANAIRDKNALLIASTDFTHYEPYEKAYEKDKKVIDAIVSGNPQMVFNKVYEYNVSMCGPGPTAAIMHASNLLDAKKYTLLKYATSGDTSGDKRMVVGYASIVIELS